jgi:ABC-type sugar transport system substrate-binding protein
MNPNRDQVTSRLATRRDFFDSGLISLPLLTGFLTGCGSSHDSRDSVAPGASRGKKRKLIWIPQAAGDWELPMRVGHLEFCKMVGWEYQHIGNPIYSVQNHLDELNNAISARPDAIVTELESPGMVSGFRKAIDAGIAMIIADQAALEEAAKLGLNVISQDCLAAGHLNGTQAAMWAETITGKKEGVIVIGNGNPGSISIDQRQKGTEEGVAAYNREHGTRYTTEAFADSGFDDVMVAISKYGAHLDQKGDRLVAMVGLGGGSGVAIWKTLKDRGIPPGKKIAGGSHDVFPDQQTGIDEGYLQWGIDSNILAMGYLSAASAWLLLERGEPCWSMHAPGELVIRKDLPRVRARTEIWMAKARDLNLLQHS